MNYSPGTAIGFYAYLDGSTDTILTCRNCFSSDSSLNAEEPVYSQDVYQPGGQRIILACDYCGEAL